VGVLALATLAQHGALWVALKTEAPLEDRARRLAGLLWYFVAGGTLLLAHVTLRIQPQLRANLAAHPWGYAFPGLALAALVALRCFLAFRKSRLAFLSSCAYIAGMLSSAAFGLFPYVLPSNSDPRLGLTVWNTAAASHGLRVALTWWIPGMILVMGYFLFVYRHFAGKVQAGNDGY